MTTKQRRQKIIRFAIEHGNTITKQQAVELLGSAYYCNESHHVGEILSRLVNNGTLTRIKPGVFQLGGLPAVKETDKQINQPTLF